MYRTMLAAIRGDAQNTLNMGLQTLSIAGVLALGILLVSTIMRVYYQEKRKFLEKSKKVLAKMNIYGIIYERLGDMGL